MTNATYMRPNQPIRMLEPADGDVYPSQLDSWLWWRNHLSTGKGAPYWDKLTRFMQKSIFQFNHEDVIEALHKSMGTPNDGVCPQCEGKARIIVEENNTGTIWCLCEVIRWQKEQIQRNRHWRSPSVGRPWTSFNPKRGNVIDPNLAKMLVMSQSFAAYPSWWLVMSGPYRIGKTHLLETIASNLGPIALYMSMADLQQKIFIAMGDDNLSDMLKEVQTAPILLLDDLGAEHSADFIQSTLLSIIGYRYRFPEEFPTAITTNLSFSELEMSWGRIGARLTDPRFEFVQVPKNMPAYGGTND